MQLLLVLAIFASVGCSGPDQRSSDDVLIVLSEKSLAAGSESFLTELPYGDGYRVHTRCDGAKGPLLQESFSYGDERRFSVSRELRCGRAFERRFEDPVPESMIELRVDTSGYLAGELGEWEVVITAL